MSSVDEEDELIEIIRYIREDRLDLLEDAVQNGFDITPHFTLLMTWASEGGHTEIEIWLRNINI
jgi:hypothetical protein